MAAFQETRDQAEQKVMVRLLSEIEKNSSFTQRNLASELGIALGMMNQYLKRCVTKGWVRISQVSPRRIKYFLTPEGFHEKSQMVTGYLARSLSFFREARVEAEQLLSICQERSWNKLGMVGAGDLADIFQLVSIGTRVSVQVAHFDDIHLFDVVVITDTQNPQKSFDTVRKVMPLERILTLDLLHISRFTSFTVNDAVDLDKEVQ